MDVDARMQLFDLKTKYQFETIPGIADYNMPLYNTQVQQGSQSIASYPIYQGFMGPAKVNGIEVPFYTERGGFYSLWPNYLNPLQPVATGDGTTTTFQLNLPFFPAIPGHLDMTGIIANINAGNANQDPYFATSFPLTSTNTINLPTTSFFPGVYITYTNANGSNTLVTDSGVFLSNATGGDLYGLLMVNGNAPTGNIPLSSNTYSMTVNTVNYSTGVVNVTFPTAPPDGSQIQAQCYFYEQGLPRAILYWNNTITLRNPPNTQYLIELDAYLSPAAFLSSSQAIPFAYMAEYIARGAARKILSDTGDTEQFMFYEPLFKEQEMLVWKRSQRIFTSNRTPTIFSQGLGISNNNNANGIGAT